MCTSRILISAATGGERAVGPIVDMDTNMAGLRGSFHKTWRYANIVRVGAPHLKKGGSITLASGAPPRRVKRGQVAIGSVGGAVEAFARSVSA